MPAAFVHPMIIQGGMGIGVSDWMLERAVSLRGHLGVVSGTALDSLFVRRLQDGESLSMPARAAAARTTSLLLVVRLVLLAAFIAHVEVLLAVK